jgi:DNA (cytosine-5)-methyltransferase 1
MIKSYKPCNSDALTAIGLFAGIGGIELGLHRAGHKTLMMCELMPEALRVLRSKPEFWGAHYEEDIRELVNITDSRELDERFPKADIITAGFPCQDLSQAGKTAGINGEQSGLVSCLLDLLSKREDSPRWVLIENVPFMLQLEKGTAMTYLTQQLESLGFRWAYRVVDTRSFGIPQRRQRVLLLASRTEDPREVLFVDEAGPVDRSTIANKLFGFYWTEGNRGLGWAIDAVPTLKGGSSLGIPSPPAIWFPRRDFVGTPDIRDAERLQGFPCDWTMAAVDDPSKRNGPRWKLVGNAVTVDLAEWVGIRLSTPGKFDSSRESETRPKTWPRAAYGEPNGKFRTINISEFPLNEPYKALGSFLNYPTRPLSIKATSGFIKRFEKSRLRKPDYFLDSLRAHLLVQQSQSENGTAAA